MNFDEHSLDIGNPSPAQSAGQARADIEIPNKKKPTDKVLLASILALLILFGSVLGFVVFLNTRAPPTLDDLHDTNLEGDLEGSQGRMFSGYSFINLDGFWYTQLKSPKGGRFYDMALRYSPWEVEMYPIEGELDAENFNNAKNYSVTFNPTGTDFSHVALAIGDFNEHMTKIFNKVPIAACDRNETSACEGRPIVNCDSDEDVIFYVKEAEETKISFNDNCILIEGAGLDLVKSTDRVLYELYGILG